MEAGNVAEARRFDGDTFVAVDDVVEITTAFVPSTSALAAHLDYSNRIKGKVTRFCDDTLVLDASHRFNSIVTSVAYNKIKAIRVLPIGEWN